MKVGYQPSGVLEQAGYDGERWCFAQGDLPIDNVGQFCLSTSTNDGGQAREANEKTIKVSVRHVTPEKGNVVNDQVSTSIRSLVR